MSNHTPTPWLAEVCEYGATEFDILSLDGKKETRVAAEVSKQDAAFIVEACNAHERLVRERDELVTALRKLTEAA
jgi:hypothetical protein